MTLYEFITQMYNISLRLPHHTADTTQNNYTPSKIFTDATNVVNYTSLADIRKVSSLIISNNNDTNQEDRYIILDGNKYRQCRLSKTYDVSKHKLNNNRSQVDRGSTYSFMIVMVDVPPPTMIKR